MRICEFCNKHLATRKAAWTWYEYRDCCETCLLRYGKGSPLPPMYGGQPIEKPGEVEARRAIIDRKSVV